MYKNIIRKMTIIAGLLIICMKISAAQIIDNYGIRVGAGISNQYWDHKYDEWGTGWKDSRSGFAGYVNVEKFINNIFSIRPELGYNQKGFSEDIDSRVDENAQPLETLPADLVLHNISFNLASKIMVPNQKVQPYAQLGVKLDYMFAYDDYYVDIFGKEFGWYEWYVEDFETTTFSGILGIGVSYDNLMYVELCYDPVFTSRIDEEHLKIDDSYIEFTIGINISTLIVY